MYLGRDIDSHGLNNMSNEAMEAPTKVYEYQNVPENKSWAGALPLKQGLYDPELEKDACGVGFAA